MTVQVKIYTANELWALSQSTNGNRLELVEGVIEESPLTGEEHGVIVSELTMLIGIRAQVNNLGRVTAAGTGYLLHADPRNGDTVLAPDIAFVSHKRASALSKTYADGAPDLAVEVVSPAEPYAKIACKVGLYLRYGTRLVWVVDPESQTIAVHTPNDTHTLGVSDTLDGGDVLPGFSLPVRYIFAAVRENGGQ
jgi:Uma2 family endonuclease